MLAGFMRYGNPLFYIKKGSTSGAKGNQRPGVEMRSFKYILKSFAKVGCLISYFLPDIWHVLLLPHF